MYLLTMAMLVTAPPVQASDPAARADVSPAQAGADSPAGSTLPLQIANPTEPPLPGQGARPLHEPAGRPDIIVRARDVSEAPDPLRALNAQSFAATQAVDRALIGPVSIAYKKNVPGPFRSGVHNFLYNVREPVVFVNFVFQHKIGKAAETVARFAINTTIGVAGIFDMAKRRAFKLPRRGNGFADTLGFYGVPSGPFMFLPIVGPTTVRDLFGGTVDRFVLPLTFGSRITRPSYAVPAGVLGVLDHRAEFDETLHTLHDNVADPYANTRAFYLQRRQAEIDHLRGHGNRNSSPMSEAPTAPIRIRGVHPAPAPDVPRPENPAPSP